VKRTTLQLVQKVSRDADCKEEGEECGDQTVVVDISGKSGAEADEAQVHNGVGRVEEGNEVAPPAHLEGVESRAGGLH
jgi:hypothetical protein